MNISRVAVDIHRETPYSTALAAAESDYPGGAFLFAGDLQLCFHGDVDAQLDAISLLVTALHKLQDEIARADGREVEAA